MKVFVAWEGDLPCVKWDCDRTFKRQRGCCGANSENSDIFTRVMDLSTRMSQLGHSILETIGGIRVTFTASMSTGTNCFGPFVRNHPIPYDVIALNHGRGYNPALGLFTAPHSGLYSFSFSAYSKAEGVGGKMFYLVHLMRNGEVMASTWEDNREDTEDSSSQTVLLTVQKGGRVYMELGKGRRLCGTGEGLNAFSGSLIYPTLG